MKALTTSEILCVRKIAASKYASESQKISAINLLESSGIPFTDIALQISENRSLIGPIKKIINYVSAKTGIQSQVITSHSRGAPVTAARHICIWLAREITGASYPMLGRHFKRDHATIMYACRKISSLARDQIISAKLLSFMDDILSDSGVPIEPLSDIDLDSLFTAIIGNLTQSQIRKAAQFARVSLSHMKDISSGKAHASKRVLKALGGGNV